MLNLMQKRDIILKHYMEGKSQWQISKETGIDRKTIRKYTREYEKTKMELSYDNSHANNELIKALVLAPKYDSSNRSKTKLTDTIIDKIEIHLKENEDKRATGRSKQQKKKIDIYEALIEEGHDISYSTVCNYIKKIYEKQKEAYIRQEYQLGEIAEYDWGLVKLLIKGKIKTIQMAAIATAKGNYRFAYLYNNQKMESFLDSHVRFYNQVGGVYKEMVYDNMKVAVKAFVSKTEKEPTEDLLKLSLYYGFRYRFCNARKGNEKGHVEKSVEYVRRKVFGKKDSFESLEEANEYLETELKKLNAKPFKEKENKSAYDILEEERPYLIPLMPSYDIARVIELRVSKYSVITIDENKYSVPDHLVGKFVFTKIYPEKILVYHDNILVAQHKRSYSSHYWTIEIFHYIDTLKKKPGALHSSTAKHQMNSKLQSIYNKHYIKNSKDFIELLELIGVIGFLKVENVIAELEKINPLGVTTEKVKMLCNRVPEKEIAIKNDSSVEIERYSRILLNRYGAIIRNEKTPFNEEVLVL